MDISSIQKRVASARELIDPMFLNTPQFRAGALASLIGQAPVVKVETVNPIRSFKGRGASLVLNSVPAGTELVCASVGNFGQGMAYAAARRAVLLTVFLSENANPLKASRIEKFGAKIIRAGTDFDAAKDAARDYARDRNVAFIEDGSALDVTVGAATIGMEMVHHFEGFDTIFVPVGNGALLNGVSAAIKKWRPETRVIGVCADGAPAMAMSWKQGKPIDTPSLATEAEGIAVRAVVPEAVELMSELADDMLLVSDRAMISAVKACFRELGLVVEPAGAAGLAAMLEHPEAVADRNAATILCGGNLSPAQIDAWLVDDPTPSA